MNHDAVLNRIKKLAGRILTIIDASGPDGMQKNALKSLVRREIRQELGGVRDFFFGPGNYTNDGKDFRYTHLGATSPEQDIEQEL